MPFTIPDHELDFQTSRAGGPGGQHVNKAETRVEVVWNVEASAALNENQRHRILRKLATRIDGTGRLRVAAQDHRSQARNKDEAVARLNALVQEALKVPRRRKPTKPSKAARERRLQEKKERAEKKKLRGPIRPTE